MVQKCGDYCEEQKSALIARQKQLLAKLLRKSVVFDKNSLKKCKMRSRRAGAEKFLFFNPYDFLSSVPTCYPLPWIGNGVCLYFG